MHSTAGYTKIGTAVYPEKRMSALQPGHPGRLRLLWQGFGDSKIEHALHAACEEWRAYVEWFDFKGQDPIEMIAKCAAPLEVVRMRSEDRALYFPTEPAAQLTLIVSSMVQDKRSRFSSRATEYGRQSGKC